MYQKNEKLKSWKGFAEVEVLSVTSSKIKGGKAKDDTRGGGDPDLGRG